MRTFVASLVLATTFVIAPYVYAQDPSGRTTAPLVIKDMAQREALADSILTSREAAAGRPLDSRYRDFVKSSLASLPVAELQAVGSQGPLPEILGILGSTRADLVFRPVTPCRIIDTTIAGSPIAANTTRNFQVTGTFGFAGQGGTPGGCGIPFGPAAAVVINYVAVAPAGAGDLRAFPFGTAVPLASIVNYAAISGLNIANGVATPVCDVNCSVVSVEPGVRRSGLRMPFMSPSLCSRERTDHVLPTHRTKGGLDKSSRSALGCARLVYVWLHRNA